ncbi:MAG: hypothetical protein QF357_05110 [Dehalococcoidia bacterium]|nr:hypothetical protein [Dehalococcoidia bacterium]
MSNLVVNQKVSVNLLGLHVENADFGGSAIAHGVIEAINPATNEITVRLNISFSGLQNLTVSPARVNPL